ncbi:DUF6888 family protein [Microseira wollei]|uniref:DUF6888 domain-containing protein n=1 Tax=Microseira wollei NIES-4236 TaxID=2530354 RepID=A0AAV3X8M1_9CYAN|nr:hypothetical protein [Microseira wollei]GET38539.1 hypothetical protein MiSe_32970 [Microseira wollei NIES-4236]
MPTDAQLRCLYRIAYQLTYLMFQPIQLICIDGRTQNLFILAGQEEEIEFEIAPGWGGAVMSQIDYTAIMSDQELRRYFLNHREDQAAFVAYLARRRERKRPVITTVNDPDFDAKILTAIRQQL